MIVGCAAFSSPRIPCTQQLQAVEFWNVLTYKNMPWTLVHLQVWYFLSYNLHVFFFKAINFILWTFNLTKHGTAIKIELAIENIAKFSRSAWPSTKYTHVKR